MKGSIDLNNKYRVLLTEVLPYELPLMLDNEGFFRNMLDEEVRNTFISTFSGKLKLKDWTVPFDYSVKKYGGEKRRVLSLIHPVTQLDCVDFYDTSDYYMLSLCQNSPFSIRYISNRAKCIFSASEIEEVDEDEFLENRVEVDFEGMDPRYRSYFSYKRYDMMYKFFNSGDYLRLEQKFSNLLIMDIADCFYHIYTHTIAWAVKGKEQAKVLKKCTTFERKFDDLMRHTNYDETNGIIVGPEISRIFAEIILQRIDVNVLNRLKREPYCLKLGRDYEVRRYVDDHYIYANSEAMLRKILAVYQSELRNYKLYINESKLKFDERPFVSNVTEAKRDINKLTVAISSKWLEKDEDGNYKNPVKNEMKAFSFIVNDFRSIVHRYNQKYGMLNRYFLSILSSQVSRELKNNSASRASCGLLLMYVEVAFYVFSLDMNVSASIKICRILDCLYKWSKKCDDKTILPELENRINREVKRCVDIYMVNQEEGDANVEILNLLLSLSRILKTPFRREQLLGLFSLSEDDEKRYERLNYFQICTLLYVIEQKDEFCDIKNMIFNEILRRLQEENAMYHADNAMLFFDVLSCPFFQKSERKDILMRVCGYTEQVAYKKLGIYNKYNRWFFNWDKSQGLSLLLSKKEYHQPYE